MSLRLSESSEMFSWNRSWKYSMTCSNIVLVRAARDEAHLLHRADDPAGVAGQRALDQLDDAGADVGRDLGDRAEVEEHDRRRLAARAGPDEEVPGVRIGVIDAVGEDLLAVDLDDLARELRCDRDRAA